MTLKTFCLVTSLLILGLLLDGCKMPLRNYPKEAIYNPILKFDSNGNLIQTYDQAGIPTASLCAEFELVDPQTLEYRHVKDWPISKCNNIFGFTPASIQKINNWVRDAIDRMNKHNQNPDDQDEFTN